MRTQCKRGHSLDGAVVARVTDLGTTVHECKRCRTVRRRMYRKGLRVKRDGYWDSKAK